MFTVFILPCVDSHFHIGITKNFEERLDYYESNNNFDSTARLMRPIVPVYKREFEDIQIALAYYQLLKVQPIELIAKHVDGSKEIPPILKEQIIVSKGVSTTLILPVTYFGNLAYFSKIKQYTHIELSATERFEKQTYRSRCTILSANGLQNLIVPVIRPNGKATLLKDIQIDYSENWVKNHIKTIESAYRRAPYYEFYASQLFSILEKKHFSLLKLNKELTEFFLDQLGINTTLSITDDVPEVSEKIRVTPKQRLTYEGQPYYQTFEPKTGFEPNLSIIDLLFNMGKNTII